MKKIKLLLYFLVINVSVGFAQSPLAGIYTLDSTLAASATNFQSFDSLSRALNAHGVSAAVTVNVAPNTYNESFGLNQIVGASSTNTITIDGGDSSTTTLTHDGSSQFGTILLDGADYVIIKNLGVEATATFGVCVLITNDADYNTIENTKLTANPSSTSNGLANFAVSGSANGISNGISGSYNTLRNSHLIGGYYSVFMNSTATAYEVENKILNNNIEQVYLHAIFVSRQDSVEVRGNKVEQDVRGSATGNALNFADVQNAIVTENDVIANFYGFYFYNQNTPNAKKTRPHLIANNMIVSNDHNGIWLRFVDSVNFWNNSILTHSTSASEPAALINRQGSNPSRILDLDVRNNIFSAAAGEAFRTNAPDSIFSKIDYNIYHSGGSVLIDIDFVDYNTLAAYQAVNLNKNVNSHEGDPQFASSTDLHIVGALFNDLGDPLVPLNFDIDGDARPIPGGVIDIGADEYNPPLCAPSSNLSFSSLLSDSVTIRWDKTIPTINSEWSIVLSGATAGSGSLRGIVSADSVGVGGLMSQTTYDFYVREICGRSDTSSWIQGPSFTTLISCPVATALNANPISSDSTILAWTDNVAANYWEIEYGVTGFTQGSGNKFFTSNNPDTITGLLPNTTYQWYIRTVCAAMDTSSWSSANSFTTLCSTYLAPFFDDVENHSATTGTISTSQCWEANAQSSSNDWNVDGAGTTPSGGTGPAGAFSGNKYFYFEASSGATGNEANLISPSIDASSLTNPMIEFYYFMFGDNRGGLGELYIDVFDGVNYTVVDSIKNEQQASMNDSWLRKRITLPTTTGVIKVRFRAYRGTLSQYGDIAIDDFSVKEAPTCIEVSSLTTTNITNTTADLSWIDPNSAAEWEVEYGATGFVLGTGTVVQVLTNPMTTLTGLTAFQSYDYYVRAVCGASDSSAFNVLPESFTAGLPLAGGYTIDSSMTTGGTNFQSFSDFGSIASLVGVSAAVYVDVVANVYNDQFSLGNITGASSSNTITIDGGNVATLTHDKSIRNSTIHLDGTSYLTIKNMTIAATGGGDSWGIYLSNNSSFITIDSNNIQMPVGTTTDVAGVMSSGSDDNDGSAGTNAYSTIITNNVITGGERGISFIGSTVASARNFKIEVRANTFTDNDDYGIYINGYDSVLVNSNVVNPPNSTLGDGLYLTNVENFEVSGNYLNAKDNGFDADDLNFDNSVTNYSIISNNMIIGGDDGLYLDDVEFVNVYHNSIYAEDLGVYINDDVSLSVKNNIFYSNSDLAFYSSDGNVIDLDYNLYFTLGTSLMRYGPLVYADLPSFQTAQPTLNINSLEGDPLYVSNGVDLHATGNLANDNGDNSVGILVDIDGDVRPMAPSINVDIGADEYFVSSSCFAPYNLTTTAITSNSAVAHWTESGTATQWQVEYGAAGFVQGTGNYLVVNVDTFVTLPGLSNYTNYEFYVRAICSAGDSSIFNAIPESFYTGVPLSGPYTIDSALVTMGTNFQSFYDFETIINAVGVSSSIYVTVAPNVYNETLGLNQIAGASAINSITIDGLDSSTTMITHDGSSQFATILLSGSDFITIKNIGVEASGTSGVSVLLTNDADNNAIENTMLVANPNTTTNDLANFALSGSSTTITNGASGSHNVLVNSNLIGGYFSVYLNSTALDYGVENKVLNNNIENVYFHAINVNNQDSVEIVGNTVEQYIRGSNNGSALNFIDVQNSIVTENNVIANFYGFYFYNNNVPNAIKTRKHLIANNMIISNNHNGVWLRFVDSVDFWNNSIQTHSTNTSEPAALINRFGGDPSRILDIDVRNNIFSAAAAEAFRSNAPDSIFSQLDNNIYFTGGTDIIEVDGVDYTSLLAYQAASPLLNINSVQGNPQFTSATDLHIAGSVFDNLGDITVPINIDIDGDMRPISGTSVDIGADEYNPSCPDPTGLFTSSITSISAFAHWIESGVATQWQVEYDTLGFVRGTGNLLVVNVDTFVALPSLMPNTNYEFYVRAICGVADTSGWSTSATFNTLLTGTNELVAENPVLNVYPNPTSGKFLIELSGFNNTKVNVLVRDINGRVINDEQFRVATNSLTKSFDLSGNANGIYFVSLIEGNRVINKKVILK